MDSLPNAPEIDPETPIISQSDLSRRAISLGRYLDRLPDGDYVLVLHKSEQQWRVSILETETLRSMELFR